MTKYKEILRLNSLGINNTRIAESLCCSRTTVIEVLHRARRGSVFWRDIEALSEREVAAMLSPHPDSTPVYKMPDYEYIQRELRRDGVTLSLLWLEYLERCRSSGELAYKQTQFYKYFREYSNTSKATMHINRKPGEAMEVDWAGNTAAITSTDTGEAVSVYVFVAVLPYSGYAYAEGFLRQNQEAWITAHVNAYNHFGGAAKLLVPDNLKTGVERHAVGEVLINKVYQELAEHYGVAVLPARVRAPKDKASVENAVGVISTWIIAALRNCRFLSLRELNECIMERLCEFNARPFQKKDGSRLDAFGEERPYLLPLPLRPFELAEWKQATVQYNYHVSHEYQNYSVPYEYIKQRVDLRITRECVEVFYGGNRVCSHPRLHGRPGQYSTAQAHMPPDHQRFVRWNGDRFRDWSRKIGENTLVVTNYLLTCYKVEQQGYKGCMALLKLADRFSPSRLEAACAKALSFSPRPGYKSIEAILKSGQDKISEAAKAPVTGAPSKFGFTRGAGYYKGGDNNA
jgi:transposase